MSPQSVVKSSQAVGQQSLFLRMKQPRSTSRDLAFADYMSAAELGDAFAQLQVGKFYWHGLGGHANREEALVWLRKAAAREMRTPS